MSGVGKEKKIGRGKEFHRGFLKGVLQERKKRGKKDRGIERGGKKTNNL